MRWLVILLFLFYTASSVHDSLTFCLMLCPGDPNVPNYMITTTVDGVMMVYYDTSMEAAQPKLDWIGNLAKEELHEWETFVNRCIAYEADFEDKTKSFKQNSSQSEGVHIIQQILSCEWDNKTGKVDGFHNFGYDGEDFLTLDLEAEKWKASNPQAELIKPEFVDKVNPRYWKNYIKNDCLYWMKKYLKYGKNILHRTDLPSVSLLQKTPSSPVSCHATGFYPDRALIFWRKDGQELHDGVKHGDMLPNHDGSFQISVSLDISSLPAKDWGKYDCVFQLSGVQNNYNHTIKLDKNKITTNWRGELTETSIIVIAVMVVVIVIIASALAITASKQMNEAMLEITSTMA